MEFFNRATISLAVFILCLSVSLNSSKRICGPNQFRCKNGRNCVAALDVCDQESHCKDGSDENMQFCNGNFTNLSKSMADVCSPGMYRCRFGGCVDASKLCDGNSDCYDSSDETQDLCRKNRCIGKNFRCDYGGCIPQRKMCNGHYSLPINVHQFGCIEEGFLPPLYPAKIILEGNIFSPVSMQTNWCTFIGSKMDCPDGSDETRTICEEHLCSLGSFKCNYGACIPGDKVCDGKNNCLDKSDELKTACENENETNGTDILDKSTDF